MANLRNSFLIIFAGLALLSALSCKKTNILTTGGQLTFSDDTLFFDTVFTAAGSFTTGLLIYNQQAEEIALSSVRLNGGASSYFKLNVNGFQGNDIKNLKIPPHDSIYVFATVNIDPNNSRTPFVVTDSLIATLNGKEYYVPFNAYGQNARYLVDSVLTTNQVWDTLLPYVIINSLGIPSGVTLTMSAGTRVYMHQNSGIVVFGKLLTKGTRKDSVIFQGDRLDRRYFGFEGYPGEWGGIYFHSTSKGSRLEGTRLENCGNGALGLAAAIWVAEDSTGTTEPQVILDKCTIKNSIGHGIFSYKGTVSATNTLVNATAGQALAIVKGGKYNFENCTFANYGGTGLSHSGEVTVAILNFYTPDGVVFEYGNLDATLKNCIVYGSLDSEIAVRSRTQATASVKLDHCLLKMGSIRDGSIAFTNCIFNEDPLFRDYRKADYRLKTGSPAINKGSTPTSTGSTDLEENARVIESIIDIGCYEYQP